MYAYARSFIPGMRIQGNTEFSDLQIGHWTGNRAGTMDETVCISPVNLLIYIEIYGGIRQEVKRCESW